MASAGNLRAGRAVIELTLLTRGVESGMRSLEARARSMSQRFAKIGTMGISGGGISGLRNLFVGSAAAAALSWPIKFAANMELATEQLSVFTGSSESARTTILGLQKFAGITGQSMEHMTQQMIVLMTRGLDTAQATDALKAIGAISMGSADQLEQLTKAFADVAQIGRLTGEEMRQFKNTGFNPLEEIAKKTGETMVQLKARSEAGALGVEEVGDALAATVRPGGRFYGMLEKIANTAIGQFRIAMASLQIALLPLGEEMLVPLKDFLKAVNGMMPAFTAWVQKNKGFVKTLLLVGSAIAGVAVFFIGFAIALKLIAIAAGGVAIVFGLISTAMGTLMTLPGLLAVAFAGLTYEFLKTSDTGTWLKDQLTSRFSEIGQTAKQTFGGVAAFLQAGQIEGAARVMWAGLQLAWEEGTGGLRDTWNAWTDHAVKAMIDMSFDVQKVWQQMLGGLQIWLLDFGGKLKLAAGNIDTKFNNFMDNFMQSLAEPFQSEEDALRNNLMVATRIAKRSGAQSELWKDVVGTMSFGENEILNKRNAKIAEIEAAQAEAQAYREKVRGEETEKSTDTIEKLKKELNFLNMAAQVAAESVAAMEDPFANEAARLQSVVDASAGGGKNLLKSEAFLDPRMIHQLAGARGVEQEQLDELHRIRRAAERKADNGGLAFG